MKVENNIQLADVAIVLIHLFHEAMHDFEGDQFIVGGSATGDKEEGGVASVDDLAV